VPFANVGLRTHCSLGRSQEAVWFKEFAISSSDDPSKRKSWQMRSSQRVNSRVAVVIEWTAGEQTVRHQGHTLNVGRSGCLLVIPHDLAIEQRVRLTNLVSNQSIDAVVVWKGEERPEGYELGLRLANPERDFWGLEYF